MDDIEKRSEWMIMKKKEIFAISRVDKEGERRCFELLLLSAF